MNDELLAQAFDEQKRRAHAAGVHKFTRRMAIEIADMLHVEPRSVIVRLEELGKLKPGSWRWFEVNGGITRKHVDQCRRERAS
jgi:hypothetical protein